MKRVSMDAILKKLESQVSLYPHEGSVSDFLHGYKNLIYDLQLEEKQLRPKSKAVESDLPVGWGCFTSCLPCCHLYTCAHLLGDSLGQHYPVCNIPDSWLKPKID